MDKSLQQSKGQAAAADSRKNKQPMADGDFFCAADLRLALAKMVENNYRVVVCTVDGDNGIQMVGKPVSFTDDDLAGDLGKARDLCKDVQGIIVVVRPVKKIETQVVQINTEGLRVRAKMVLANATLWVRINGDCSAKGNEIVIDKIDELQPEMFK